jgi:uncharacterized surface anchored protein
MMNQILKSIIESNKLEYEVLNTNSKKSLKDKIINSINNEIRIINGRENLELLEIKNKIKENRFWKFYGSSKELIYVNIKYKGKIFGMGEVVNRKTPPYFKVKNDKNKLITFLTSIKLSLEDINENDNNFWKI